MKWDKLNRVARALALVLGDGVATVASSAAVGAGDAAGDDLHSALQF